MPISKFMLSWGTTFASNNWLRYPMWCGISGLLGTRGHTRSGCISQSTHIPVLYDRIWASSSHWAEANYTRTGLTMVFWKLIYSIWASKNDCCGCRCKKTFQETLRIPVHAVARGNHKSIINEGFHRYLNKVHTINSADKGSLHQWLQFVLFALYAWNAGPVDGTDISRSVVAIRREFSFTMDLSPSKEFDSWELVVVRN